jgi:hypothetical protein
MADERENRGEEQRKKIWRREEIEEQTSNLHVATPFGGLPVIRIARTTSKSIILGIICVC